MSDVEAALRAAFEHASDSLTPPADLDVRVRRATRRRRRGQAAAIVVAVAVGASAFLIATTGAAQHGGGPLPSGGAHHAGRFLFTDDGDAIAADGRMVYVATGDYPVAKLNAYNRATGRLVRRIGIPALPNALRIGPDGSVWLAFYPDQNGGGTGVWRLSPDLARRSGIDLSGRPGHVGSAPFDVLVTSANSAVLGTDHGIAVLRLPAPGASGRPVMRWRRVHPAVPQGYPVRIFPLAHHVAVLWDTDAGRAAISVLGRPGLVYRHGLRSIAAEGGGLWVATNTQAGAGSEALIRLDQALRVVTPGAVAANPDLARPEDVLAYGSTVWVLRPGWRSLACFTYQSGRIGPVAVIRTSSPVGQFAPTAATVYVLGKDRVATYAVPAPCRRAP